ncbi:MAG: hypothetical protein H6Q85_1480, partial [candidate division NC10 bacterium]|nr:hypothetical protein [candidate division NC10 bacterium]
MRVSRGLKQTMDKRGSLVDRRGQG